MPAHSGFNALRSGVTITGVAAARGTLLAVRGNLINLSGAAEPMFEMLNAEYVRKFDRWGGYMVETGATRDAWTQNDAPGALRDVHATWIEFGSTIDYNRFHYKALTSLPTRVDTKVSEVFAEHFVPESRQAGGFWARATSRGLAIMPWLRKFEDRQ